MMEADQEICDSATQPYSIMPTVLALQQMKSRLDVAQAGKELMRWSSNNMGVELRKISSELQAVYTNFGRDMKQAFLLLSRCKYFNQDFYRNVTESVKSASVYVQCSCTTLAGVKMLYFTPLEITNKKVCKCPFLCRGGQAIQEATKVWSDLLRSHIKMAELRTNFLAIEAAYRDSTKRLNIISQIVLPKTKATVSFILDQLEETTREESNRIRIKSSKLRNSSNISCGYSSSYITYFKQIKKEEDEESEKELTANLKSIYDVWPSGVSLYDIQSEPINGQKTQPASTDIYQMINIYEPMIEQKSRHRIDSLGNFYEYVSSGTEPWIPKQRMSLGDFEPTINLPKLDKATYAMDELLEACRLTRKWLSPFASDDKMCQAGSRLTLSLGQLKSHIDAVIQANSKLQNSATIPKSIKYFIKSCENIDEDLKYTIKDIDTIPLDKNGKKRIQHLLGNIDDVIEIITDYRSEVLLPPSLEMFSKVYNETKTKISFYISKHDLQSLDYLKSCVYNLESITADITQDCIRTPSIQNFLSSCKGFREKLEEHKRRKKQPISENKANKLIKQQQEVETDAVLLAETVQQFVSYCEDIIKRLQRNESAGKIIDSINTQNIVNNGKLMTKLQNQDLVSKSTIACLMAKNKTYKSDENNDENMNGDFRSHQSETCKRFSESFNTSPANKKLQDYSTSAKKDEQKEIDVKEKVLKLEVKEDKIDNLENKKLKRVKIGKSLEKILSIASKVKGNIVKSVEKAVRSKPTQFPIKLEKENEDQTCTSSFELSEVSQATFCTDSSCMQSDTTLADINTNESCPLSDSKHSISWVTKSSDSWLKPLLPHYCLMCSSQSSSDSSQRQVCEKCMNKHDREKIIRAMAKTNTA